MRQSGEAPSTAAKGGCSAGKSKIQNLKYITPNFACQNKCKNCQKVSNLGQQEIRAPTLYACIWFLQIDLADTRKYLLSFDLTTIHFDIQPQRDLYGRLLFQGERFQRLQQIYRLLEQPDSSTVDCLFTAAERLSSLEGEELLKNRYLLGDPFFWDALLHRLN